jgi:hypothetical protein
VIAIEKRVRSAYEGVDEEEEVRYRGEGHHCVAKSVVLSVLQQQLTQRLHEIEEIVVVVVKTIIMIAMKEMEMETMMMEMEMEMNKKIIMVMIEKRR